MTVIGLGKMGLPFAVNCAQTNKAFQVIGCDIDGNLVSAINSGICPIEGEPMLPEALVEVLEYGNFVATTDIKHAIQASEVIVVLVPVYVDASGQPAFQIIDEVTSKIAECIQPGTLVSYETTLPVGTTRNRFAAAIQEKSKLQPEIDFFVCFSPERVSSGTVFQDLKKYPKLLGGIGPRSESKGVDFYNEVLTFEKRPDLAKPNGVWSLGKAEAAEFAKLAETTYRDVNIGLANQFAIYAGKIDVDFSKIIEACNSQPYSHLHRPGIAVGGHCIPVYPKMYLLNDPDASIVGEARKQNEAMPEIYVTKLTNFFGGSLAGKVVVILGLAYRTGVKEDAFSGAYQIRDALAKRGARVLVHDYLFSQEEIHKQGFEAYSFGEFADAAVLHTPDNRYVEQLRDSVPNLQAVLDGREFFSSPIKPGIEIIGLN